MGCSAFFGHRLPHGIQRHDVGTLTPGPRLGQLRCTAQLLPGHSDGPSHSGSLYCKHGIENLVGGWATPLKNMNVNWDD